MAIDFELLHDSPHLLEILVQIEDVLDRLDTYVFPNWIDGEVVDGPRVRRYWLDITLRYPYKKMPDPRAALRLLKHGVRVDFRKAKVGEDDLAEDVSVETAAEDADADASGANDDKVWLITISVPRRLVTQLAGEEMDYYDDEVDVDDAQEAKDTGIDDESAYREDEQQAQQQGGDPNAIPDDQQAQQQQQGGQNAPPPR